MVWDARTRATTQSQGTLYAFHPKGDPVLACPNLQFSTEDSPNSFLSEIEQESPNNTR